MLRAIWAAAAAAVVTVALLVTGLGGWLASLWPGSPPVPVDVTGARIVWHFPLAAPPSPRSWNSALDQATARALADAVDAAPRWPAGSIACPMDNGSTAQITFRRSGGGVQTVTALLTGCAGIAGEMPAAAARILTRAGPPGVQVNG